MNAGRGSCGKIQFIEGGGHSWILPSRTVTSDCFNLKSESSVNKFQATSLSIAVILAIKQAQHVGPNADAGRRSIWRATALVQPLDDLIRCQNHLLSGSQNIDLNLAGHFQIIKVKLKNL